MEKLREINVENLSADTRDIHSSTVIFIEREITHYIITEMKVASSYAHQEGLTHLLIRNLTMN